VLPIVYIVTREHVRYANLTTIGLDLTIVPYEHVHY